MKIFLFVLIMLKGCDSSHNDVLYGVWENQEDINYILNINEKNIYEIYQNDSVAYNYNIINQSCDTNYIKNTIDGNISFISLDDGRCFEILNITREKLIYRHTTTGNIQIFNKINR